MVGSQTCLRAPFVGQVAFERLAIADRQGRGGEDDFGDVACEVPHRRSRVAVTQQHRTVPSKRLVDGFDQ